MTVEAKITGCRCVENSDSTDVHSDSNSRETDFTERWRLELDGDQRHATP
jgi:hypothetical protein